MSKASAPFRFRDFATLMESRYEKNFAVEL